MSICVKSPAKLNLFLHITGQREDGYHQLQTLFQFVDYYDELNFTPLDTDGISVSPPIPGLDEQQNLIFRAAHKLQQATGCKKGAHIEVIKRLPMGGGLGGGSSNAATTLVSLNKLWGTNLSNQELRSLGLTLGADVPIFIFGHSALAEGVGELLESVIIPEPWYLIAHPHCHADTRELFQEKQLTRDSKVIKIRDFLRGQGHNDFEPVLRKRFPLIDRCMNLMAAMTPESNPKVTGSGSCLFSQFDSQEAAEICQTKASAKMNDFGIGDSEVDWIIAKGHNRSPLYSGPLAK